MARRLAIVTMLTVPSCAALVLGTRARPVAARACAARADLSSFEKSFMDDLYMEDYLEKNKILCQLNEALPSLIKGADGLALREGIDEAREAGASVKELKRFVEALKKADPSLVTETDEAILLGAEQVVIASAPQPARPPPDSFLTDEQFQTLLEASKSPEPAWDPDRVGKCPEDLLSAWGKPQIFFSLLRHPRIDPSAVVWDAVRYKWPTLQGVPDEELQKNLVECRKEACDARFI